MSGTSFRCYDRIAPLVLHDEFADVAVSVNPENRRVPLAAPDGFEAAGEPARFWRPGTTLRVLFLDGEPALRVRVLAAAAAWTAHANLDLAAVSGGAAEIRVSFVGDGNWSALGTDAVAPAMFPPDQPTMCLSEVPGAAPARVDRLARHEFGHAIGLVHEHSSPASGMRWDREAVLAELAGPPNHWSPAEVEWNVFHRYAATTTQHTEFDPLSVMLYAFPASWTLDDVSHRENSELSALDAAFVRAAYPGR